MILPFVWAQSRWLAEMTLGNRSNLCLAVYWCFAAPMRRLSANMTMCTNLLHPTALWAPHWGFGLSPKRLVGPNLLTHNTLIMVCIILDWLVLLVWILRRTVWLKDSRSTRSLLFSWAILLGCRNRLGRGLNDRGVLLKNLIEIQPTSCCAFLLLYFCIVKFDKSR